MIAWSVIYFAFGVLLTSGRALILGAMGHELRMPPLAWFFCVLIWPPDLVWSLCKAVREVSR